MQFTFTHRDSKGADLDTFIKLGERYNEGFRLKPGEHIVVFNNTTMSHSDIIDTNDDLEVFVKTIYFKQWQPLEDNQFHDILERNVIQEPKQVINNNVIVDRPNNILPKPNGEIADKVNPQHYKGFFQEYQWIEAMQWLVPDVDSLLIGQIHKYMARSGKKDDVIQEALKSLWYHKFLAARMVAGRNIKIAEVEAILSPYNVK